MTFLFCLVVAVLFELAMVVHASSNNDHDDAKIEAPFDDNVWFGLIMAALTVGTILSILASIALYMWCKKSCVTKKDPLVMVVLSRDIENGDSGKKGQTVVSTTAIVQPEIVADAA